MDRPLAYREKIGPFHFTMTYRHEYPQVDDERLGTAFAVFHEVGTDIVAAAVELKLVKVPRIHSSADLVYVLDTYSGEMLSLALAATEALDADLCRVFNAHRVIYISIWEVRKPWRGEGLGVALLHQALERLPIDVDGRPNALCVAPEPYQTEMKHFETAAARAARGAEGARASAERASDELARSARNCRSRCIFSCRWRSTRASARRAKTRG